MADDRCTTSELFDALWAALTDVIGPTAAATLLQESIRRARASQPGIEDVTIVQRQFEYTYAVPPSWKTTDTPPRQRFQAIVEELWPLLVGLTGSLVVRRLSAVPQLVECGVIPRTLKPSGRPINKEAKW